MTENPPTATRTADAARAFPAFPAGRRGGRSFARTWWGRAWIQAVEDSALDQDALKNGRKYACSGRVGAITIRPGGIAATVHGAADTYRTTLALPPLTPAQWGRFLDQVAARAGHIAALLDRDMPHDLVTAAEDVGVPLLPGLGEPDPECTCDDWGHPCRHAAALAYQVAWLLDADPFLLVLLRGRGEADFLGELQHRGEPPRSAPSPDDPAAAHPADDSSPPRAGGRAGARVPHTVPAADAYAQPPAALPDPPELPDAPGETPPIDAGPGIDPAALRLLAKDAAIRALDFLRGTLASDALQPPPDAADLGEHADGIRLAALHPDAEDACARLRAAEGCTV